MASGRWLAVVSLLALPLAGCDGRAEAAVSTAYMDAAAEAVADTVGTPVSTRIWTWPIIDPAVPRAPDISHGDPSPDGRLVSLVDWASGALGVWEQATDSVRYLSQADWSTGYHFGWSAFSPDGSSIGYTWIAPDETGEMWTELRVVDSRGSEEPRILVRMPEGETISPTDWGEPGILATSDRPADSLFRVVVVDPGDGDVRVVIEAQRPMERPVFSPDGRTIAFGRQGEIHLVRSEGGDARPTGIEGSLVGWPRNGAGLYFYDREGDIRAVDVLDRQTVGTPRLVRRDGAGWGIGVSDDALFTSVQLDGRRIHVVEVDGDGRWLGEPRPISPLSRGQPKGLYDTRSDVPALSPDGQTVAYVQAGRIQVASVDGQRIRELSVNGELGGALVNLTWGPDGESLWYRLGRPGGAVVQRYDLRTGEAVDVTEWTGFWTLDPVRSVVYQTEVGDSVQSGIWAYDYETEERRLVVEVPPGARHWSICVAPDGARLAYFSLDESSSTYRLMAVPVEGGASREIHEVPRGAAFFPTYWSPDGTRVFYLTVPDNPEAASSGYVLMSASVDGGEPTAVAEFPHDFPAYPLSINLAAGRMAFAAGLEKAELWKTEVATPRR